MFTDTSECYKVFQVVKGFSTGVYTKSEFKSKLKNLDLSDLENYREHIKVLIKDTLKEDKPVIKSVEKVEELVEEVAVENESIEEVVKPVYSRKKSYKAEAE